MKAQHGRGNCARLQGAALPCGPSGAQWPFSASFRKSPCPCTALPATEGSESGPVSGLWYCAYRKIHVPGNLPSSSSWGSLSLTTERCMLCCWPKGQNDEQLYVNLLVKFCWTKWFFFALTSWNVLGEPLFKCTNLKNSAMQNMLLGEGFAAFVS